MFCHSPQYSATVPSVLSFFLTFALRSKILQRLRLHRFWQRAPLFKKQWLFITYYGNDIHTLSVPPCGLSFANARDFRLEVSVWFTWGSWLRHSLILDVEACRCSQNLPSTSSPSKLLCGQRIYPHKLTIRSLFPHLLTAPPPSAKISLKSAIYALCIGLSNSFKVPAAVSGKQLKKWFASERLVCETQPEFGFSSASPYQPTL